MNPAPAPPEATRAVEPTQAQPQAPQDQVPQNGEETRRVPPADADPDPPARPGDT